MTDRSRVGIAFALVACGFAANALAERGKHDRVGSSEAAPPSATEVQQAQVLYANTCALCHGQQREGAIGPSLVAVGERYSLAKIERIAQEGKGKKQAIPMPAGLVSAEQARLLARWLVTAPPVAKKMPDA